MSRFPTPAPDPEVCDSRVSGLTAQGRGSSPPVHAVLSSMSGGGVVAVTAATPSAVETCWEFLAVKTPADSSVVVVPLVFTEKAAGRSAGGEERSSWFSSCSLSSVAMGVTSRQCDNVTPLGSSSCSSAWVKKVKN